MPTDEFERFAIRIGWISVVINYARLLFPALWIVLSLFILNALPLYGLALLSTAMLLLGVLIIYVWKIMLFRGNPSYNCPICGGSIVFYKKTFPGKRHGIFSTPDYWEEYIQCMKCKKTTSTKNPFLRGSVD